MRSIQLLSGLFLLAGALAFGAEAQKLYTGTPLKVLLVTGGGYHDYVTQATILPELIKARGDFTVDVIGPDWVKTKEALKKDGWANGYDVIVYNICDAENVDKEMIHNIAKVHIEGTTPAVVIHAALHSFHWKIGTDRQKYEEGEEWVKVMGIASGSHGKKAPITVKAVQADHPIMAGLPKEWKTPNGELYNSHQVLPTATPLATGTNGDAKQGEQVCIWVNQCEKTRVFGTSLGHHNETMQAEPYGDLLVRGLLWACDKLK